MSDRMRWRYGDTNSVIAPVSMDSTIEIGDLVWRTQKGRAVAVADALTCEHAAKQFLGVAMQRSRVGDDDPIRVACTGTFELATQPGTEFIVGDHIFLVRDENQEVRGVTAGMQNEVFIGRCHRKEADTGKSVFVQLYSRIMNG